MKKRKVITIAGASILLATAHFQCDIYAAEKKIQEKTNRPNFITLVIDDMGFSDIGAFGGEIPTPNLDQLAADGIMLTNFYAAPSSSPSRSMLFTGRDNHRVGMGSMGPEAKPPLDIPIFPELLSGAGGYYTMMVGKWHLGHTPEYYPHNRGFERSYVLLEGGDTHFLSDAEGKHVSSWSPEKRKKLGRKTYYNKDGVELREFPPEAYSTDLYTNVAMEMLDEWDGNRPFYLYLSYIAVHSPWQAPQNVTAKYIDLYSKGWDVLRQERFERQKSIGLVASDAKLPPRPEDLRAWDSLPKEVQKIEAKRMAVYGAMIDVLDTNVGILIDYLKRKGMYNNTVFYVYSDNGAAEGVEHVREPGDFETDYVINNFVTDFPGDNEEIYNKLGDGDCFPTASTKEWAWLSNTPLKGFKGSTYEGGTHTMAFIHYPKSNIKGSKNNCLVSVRDFTATILDMAEVEYPKEFKGGTVAYPPVYFSIADLIMEGSDKCHREILGMGVNYGPAEVRGLRMGDWKISENPAKTGEGKLELYNIKKDPFEQNDLSKSNPGKYQDMVAEFNKYLKTSGQIPSNQAAEKSMEGNN